MIPILQIRKQRDESQGWQVAEPGFSSRQCLPCRLSGVGGKSARGVSTQPHPLQRRRRLPQGPKHKGLWQRLPRDCTKFFQVHRD